MTASAVEIDELLRSLEKELHDLCQPVTALQCRLEVGKICGDVQSLLEAADGGLEDTQRIFTAVAQMRARIVAAMRERRP